MRPQLVVGLGNPGEEYRRTRHNAGFWWVDALAAHAGASFRRESRFLGEVARIADAKGECWLLKPGVYMNRSGEAVAAMAQFYKIPAAALVVAHDELDLPPGTARLKQGGGHGGHNGLRDILSHLGSADFLRLRLGIGHPGDKTQVVNYVLKAPPAAERDQIEASVQAALAVSGLILAGEVQQAMHQLHTKTE